MTTSIVYTFGDETETKISNVPIGGIVIVQNPNGSGEAIIVQKISQTGLTPASTIDNFIQNKQLYKGLFDKAVVLTRGSSTPPTNINPDTVNALYLDEVLNTLYICKDKTENANVWVEVSSDSASTSEYSHITDNLGNDGNDGIVRCVGAPLSTGRVETTAGLTYGCVFDDGLIASGLKPVIKIGIVSNVDTTAWVTGTVLYGGYAGGVLSDQISPNIIQEIATVVEGGSLTGTLHVHVKTPHASGDVPGVLYAKIVTDANADKVLHISLTGIPITATDYVNVPPLVDAGLDQVGIVGTPITLTGVSSDSDGTIASVQWSIGGTELATSNVFDYTPGSAGTDTLTFKATDNYGDTATDTMDIVVTEPVVVNQVAYLSYKHGVTGTIAVDQDINGKHVNVLTRQVATTENLVFSDNTASGITVRALTVTGSSYVGSGVDGVDDFLLGIQRIGVWAYKNAPGYQYLYLPAGTWEIKVSAEQPSATNESIYTMNGLGTQVIDTQANTANGATWVGLAGDTEHLLKCHYDDALYDRSYLSGATFTKTG